jgi:hypothetical protein
MKLLATLLSLLTFALANPLQATQEVSNYQVTENGITKTNFSPATTDIVIWELIQYTGLGCTGPVVAEFSRTDDALVCVNFLGNIGAQAFRFSTNGPPGDGPYILNFFAEQGCQFFQTSFENIDGLCLSLEPGAAAAFSFEVFDD